MRSKSLLTLIVGLMLAAIGISRAQTQLTLMPYTNEWRYLVTNALPTGWSASNYPAANGWPVGNSVLAFPANEPMPQGVPAVNTVLMTNFNGMIVTSFYFRASITLTLPPNQLIITGSAVIDDGAVIYVNGREVQRVRMPAGAVNHRTLASAGGEVSARIDTFGIASSNFVQGVNVIAAEVHQDAHTSSDVVFGMQLSAQFVDPIIITSQPEDQTVDVGLPAVFSVTATGTSPRYQWFTNAVPNPVPILNATNASYTNFASTLAMSGRIFHVVVSNVLGSVRSSNAVLTVVQDRNGPVMLSAVATASNTVEIKFNENITQNSSTNLSNYIVHLLGTTNILVVTQTQWGISISRLRLAGLLDSRSNYVVCASNIVDQLWGNVSFPDCIPVSFSVTTNVIAFGETWRWNEAEREEAPTNSAPGVDWKHVNYHDNPAENFNWAEAPAPLGADFSFTGTVCETHPGTLISRTPVTTYIRRRFVLGGPVENATMTLRHTVDDGAIFYLNGTEIFRINMPAGPVSYSTLAPTTNEARCLSQGIPGMGHLLVPGTNVLAVELHQTGEIADDLHDVWFDAELTLTFLRTPIIPALGIARVRSGSITNVVVTWQGTGWQLQHAINLTGPWTNLTSTPVMGTNRYTGNIATLGTRRFYRLKNP